MMFKYSQLKTKDCNSLFLIILFLIILFLIVGLFSGFEF